MIRYLRSIGEFGFSIAAKVVDWLAESLFLLKKFLSRRTTTTKRGFVMNSNGEFHGEEEELESGLGSVRFSPGLERTRILISSSVRESLSRSAVEIPVAVESPPIQEIRGVDHDELKNLKLESKSIREEASLIAKRIHFAYTTPKKTRPFRNSIDLQDSTHQADDDIEPPRAPKRARSTKVMRKEQLSSVSVKLFP